MQGKEDVDLMAMIAEEQRARFEDNRRGLQEQTRQQIQKTQVENSKTYNKKRVEATMYKDGDIVAISRTQWGPASSLQ